MSVRRGYPPYGPATAITPSDFGYKAWAYDPMNALNATAPTTTNVYVSRLQFRGDDTVTSLVYGIVSIAGAALTAGQCFAGLFDSTGARVGVTADLSGSFGTTGELTFPLTAPTPVSAGFYWSAILMVGSTIPTFARAQGQITNLGSAQVVAAQRRFALAATAQTSVPLSFTPSSLTTVLTQNFWAAAV